MAFLPPWIWVFSLFLSDLVLPVVSVLSFSSANKLCYRITPRFLHDHYFLPNVKQSSLFLFVKWCLLFPTHRFWHIISFLLPFKAFLSPKARLVVGDCPSCCSGYMTQSSNTPRAEAAHQNREDHTEAEETIRWLPRLGTCQNQQKKSAE